MGNADSRLRPRSDGRGARLLVEWSGLQFGSLRESNCDGDHCKVAEQVRLCMRPINRGSPDQTSAIKLKTFTEEAQNG